MSLYANALTTFLESYGWPILITGGAAFALYNYFRPTRAQRAFQPAFPGARSSHSQVLVERLSAAFPHHPNFFRGSIAETVIEAQRLHKIVLLYLHKPQATDPHDVTQHPFCRDVLCTEFVSDLLNANFICWAGVAGTPECTWLQSSLRVRTHPFLAVLAPGSGSQRNVLKQLWRLQNVAVTAEELLVQLVEVVEHREALVSREAEEEASLKAALSFNRQLVQEQDQEYQRALAASLEPVVSSQSSDLEVETEKLERLTQELKQRAIQEEKAQEQARANEQHAEARRQALLAKLGPEPTDGVSVRLRLPDGTSVSRKFAQDALMGAVFDFVETRPLSDVELPEERTGAGLVYQLVTSHPRRVYIDPVQPVSQLGKAVVLVLELLVHDGDE